MSTKAETAMMRRVGLMRILSLFGRSGQRRRVGLSALVGLGVWLAQPSLTWADQPGSGAAADVSLTRVEQQSEPADTAQVPGAPKARAVWIDVRTPREFEAGHLPGAILIPFDRIQAQIASVVPDKATPIMLYCRSGSRAEVAREVLLGMGYTQVENRGAYRTLKEAGEPR